MSNSFFAVLPSNVKDYPENRPNRYRVHLPKRVQLSGNYVCGLYSIQFPFSWSTTVGTLDEQWIEIVLGEKFGIGDYRSFKIPIPSASLTTVGELTEHLKTSIQNEALKYAEKEPVSRKRRAAPDTYTDIKVSSPKKSTQETRDIDVGEEEPSEFTEGSECVRRGSKYFCKRKDIVDAGRVECRKVGGIYDCYVKGFELSEEPQPQKVLPESSPENAALKQQSSAIEKLFGRIPEAGEKSRGQTFIDKFAGTESAEVEPSKEETKEPKQADTPQQKVTIDNEKQSEEKKPEEVKQTETVLPEKARDEGTQEKQTKAAAENVQVEKVEEKATEVKQAEPAKSKDPLDALFGHIPKGDEKSRGQVFEEKIFGPNKEPEVVKEVEENKAVEAEKTVATDNEETEKANQTTEKPQKSPEKSSPVKTLTAFETIFGHRPKDGEKSRGQQFIEKFTGPDESLPLVSEISRAVGSVEFEYLKDLNRFKVNVDHPAIDHLVMSEQLAYVLGFPNHKHIEVGEKARYGCDVQGGFSSFAVYARGLTEDVILGNSLSSLLRIIAVDGDHRPGATIEKIYDSPMYVRVLPREINEIELELRTLTGEYVPFQYGTVLITLVFKKVINL
jgi:hypothetical protein